MKHALILFIFSYSASQKTGFTQQAANPGKGEPTNAKEADAQKAKADDLTEERYQALVAKLPPDQQHGNAYWKRNSAGFICRCTSEPRSLGNPPHGIFVQDDPKLPPCCSSATRFRVATRRQSARSLAGKANVHRAPANCGPTATGLKNIEVWLGDGKWDLIHFNFGIHDPQHADRRLYATARTTR